MHGIQTPIASLPPPGFGILIQRCQSSRSSDIDQSGTDRVSGTDAERTLENQVLFARDEAQLGKKRLRGGIRHQKSGGLTATVNATIEGIARIGTASINPGRPARTQVLLCTSHQFGANPPPPKIRVDHDRADNPVFMTESRAVGIGPEPGVNESDHLTIVTGENHARWVKISLSDNQLVKLIAPQPRRGATSQLALIPHPQDVRGIGVFELSIFDHGERLLDDQDPGSDASTTQGNPSL